MRFGHRVLLAVALVAVALPAHAQSVCRLIVVADTEDGNIGESVAIDADNVTSKFVDNLPVRQLAVTKLTGRQVSKNNVLRAIRTTTVRSGDTLVFYYAGHGGFVRPGGGQFLATPGGRLFRTEVVAAVKQRKPRLAVVITDTCSNYVKTGIQVAPMVAKSPAPTRPRPLFQSLFFDARGLVDLSGTQPGEIAMGNDIIGGYFTSSLCHHLEKDKQHKLSWKSFVGSVRSETARVFKKEHPQGIPFAGDRQRTQTVFASITGPGGPKPPPPVPGQGPRFGVRAVNALGGGVVIAEVTPNSPATRVTVNVLAKTVALERGDRILEINGRVIRNEAEYGRAVDDSGRTMRMRVRNVRDGKVYDMTVQLRD